MGMLLRRHYINALDDGVKGAINEVAPNVVTDDKGVAPSTVEKTPSKVAENSPNYTKTIINRTSTDDLKKIAGSIGISDADSFTGAELKKMIISKLGL